MSIFKFLQLLVSGLFRTKMNTVFVSILVLLKQQKSYLKSFNPKRWNQNEISAEVYNFINLAAVVDHAINSHNYLLVTVDSIFDATLGIFSLHNRRNFCVLQGNGDERKASAKRYSCKIFAFCRRTDNGDKRKACAKRHSRARGGSRKIEIIKMSLFRSPPLTPLALASLRACVRSPKKSKKYSCSVGYEILQTVCCKLIALVRLMSERLHQRGTFTT